MITPVVRPAVAGDLPAVVSLLAADELGRGREDPSLPLDGRYLSAFAAIQEDANQLLAVAVVEGEVVGCLQLSFIPGLSRLGAWRGQIESVRVAPSMRGRGVGAAMIRWAVEEARRRGCVLVQLTTDKSRADAHRFYEALGFVASHEGLKLSLQPQGSVAEP